MRLCPQLGVANALQTTMSAPTAPLCAFYLRNACTRGEQCRFSHNISSSSPVAQTRTARIPCNFYLLGKCRNGAQCHFSHQWSTQALSANWREKTPLDTLPAPKPDTSGLETKSWRALDSPVNGPRREVAQSGKPPAFGPCRYYLQGRCVKGDTCPFPHTRTNGDTPMVTSDFVLAKSRVSGCTLPVPIRLTHH